LIPEDLEEQELVAEASGYPIANLLKDLGLTASTSESNRMIQQGAVKVNGDRVTDSKLGLTPGDTYIVQVGKRKIAKVKLKA
jgi:tyrosyl-tRNA synthetase